MQIYFTFDWLIFRIDDRTNCEHWTVKLKRVHRIVQTPNIVLEARSTSELKVTRYVDVTQGRCAVRARAGCRRTWRTGVWGLPASRRDQAVRWASADCSASRCRASPSTVYVCEVGSGWELPPAARPPSCSWVRTFRRTCTSTSWRSIALLHNRNIFTQHTRVHNDTENNALTLERHLAGANEISFICNKNNRITHSLLLKSV